MTTRMLVILALLVALGTITMGQPTPASRSASAQPNFVVVVVDDLDVGSVSYMPAVNRHLVASGTTFSRFFATTPLCCPSRASILRGQYAHNHRVLRNTGDDAGFAAFKASGDENQTLASTLQSAGYETALIGKYLNGYAYPRDDSTYIPPGWDFWVAGVDHDAYNSFNYALNVNGEIVNHGRDERDYMTDVLAEHALAFLDTSAEFGGPFFLYLAPYAPHSPSTPAPRHKGMFSGATAPRGPAFNERNIQDKPDWVKTSRLSDERISRIDGGYQDRLESLMAVDEMVDAVVQRLDAQGVLSSTYILFLSDNGYFLGEHRQPHGKDAPYDAASRVPLIMRGPGIGEGATIEEIALNIDLFPTVTELAAVPTPWFVDGRSIVPLLTQKRPGWRQVALIEGFGKETESNEADETSTPAFAALRSPDILYTEYETGERELYDLGSDPHQLINVARETPNTLLREYSRRLKALTACAANECATWENEPIPLGTREEPDKGARGDKGKEHKQGTRSRETDRGKDKRGERSDLQREPVPARERRLTASDGHERQVTVGGSTKSAASFRLEIPDRGGSAADLALRVHIASVLTRGTLVALREPSESAPGSVSAASNVRLGDTDVHGKGWATIDVSGAVGDSSVLTIILRGRDRGEFSVSGSGSGNPPRLVSGSTDPNSAGRERAKRSEREHRVSVDRRERRKR